MKWAARVIKNNLFEAVGTIVILSIGIAQIAYVMSIS